MDMQQYHAALKEKLNKEKVEKESRQRLRNLFYIETGLISVSCPNEFKAFCIGFNCGTKNPA